MTITLAASATITALIAATISPGSLAAAADEWTMPDVTGEILQVAVGDVQGAVGDAPLNISYDPGSAQVVYNMANWQVCETTPSAGDAISQKSRDVSFSIKRLSEEC